jgi:hypothetical protein
MERVTDTAIGECLAFISSDDGPLSVEVLADVFEADDERYPKFDLLRMIDDFIDSNTWLQNTPTPKLDADAAVSLRSFCDTLRAKLDAIPVMTQEEIAAMRID